MKNILFLVIFSLIVMGSLYAQNDRSKVALKQKLVSEKDFDSLMHTVKRQKQVQSEKAGVRQRNWQLREVFRSSNPDAATITLTAGDVWGNDSGYVLLIGDHEGLVEYEDVFPASIYKIPENATVSLNTPVVFENSISIEIPGGTYDYWLFNPDQEIEYSFPLLGSNAFAKDFTFKNGWSYLFEVFPDEEKGERVERSIVPLAVDLSIRQIVLPSLGSRCGFSSEEKLGFVIENLGALPSSSSFTIAYDVDGITGNEEYNLFISSRGKSDTLYLSQKFDFSQLDRYSVLLTVTDVADATTDNNSMTTKLFCWQVGVLELPFSNDFSTLEDIVQFYFEGSSWRHYDTEGFKDFTALEISPLYTPCLDFAAGNYKLDLGYMASSSMYEETEDFLVLIGKSGTDIATWTVIAEYLGQNTADDYVTDSVFFSITDPGTYKMAFLPIRLIALAIEHVNISAVPVSGLPDNQLAKAGVYASGNILTVNSGQSIDYIVVNDIKGSLVYKSATGLNKNKHQENIAGWAKGVYMARIATANDVKTLKFIVK